jgi:hypothetical protein
MNKRKIPTGYEKLMDFNGEAIECPKCGEFDTYGDWDSDMDYEVNDDGSSYPVLNTMGTGFCRVCGHTWKL